MIIYFSNRDVHEDRVDTKPTKLFGNNFNLDGDDQIRMCVSELHDNEAKWSYNLVNKGQEKRRLSSIRTRIKNETLTSDWLLFLHGNNQGFDDNIKKCQKLAELYKVNVIAFSWPSRPKVDKEGLSRAAKKLSFQGWIVAALATAATGILGRKLFRKLSQYLTAEINAKRSAPAFNSVLGLVQDELQGKLPGGKKVNLNFLSYSLGNRVLMYTATGDDLENGDGLFKNHTMCQADVDHDGHEVWARDISYGDNLYITHNEFDLVLGTADIQNKDRLGNTTDDLPLPLPCRYVDFTEGKSVESTHALFFLKEDDDKKPIRRFFKKALLGTNVFPNRKPPVSSGFKYNARFNTYSLVKTVPYMEPSDDLEDE